MDVPELFSIQPPPLHQKRFLEKKNVTLDPRPSIWHPRPRHGTLDLCVIKQIKYSCFVMSRTKYHEWA